MMVQETELTVRPAIKGETTSLLTAPERLRLGSRLMRDRVKEYLRFDSTVARFLAGWFGLAVAGCCSLIGKVRKRFEILCALHRVDFCSAANRQAEHLVHEAAAAAAEGREHPILNLYEERVAYLRPTAQTQKFFDDPDRLLGSLAMVLKSPAADEKGVLLLQYSFTFPLFAKLFDLPRIAEKYYIVIEPDWSGYCSPNVVAYSRYRFPVFVEAFEPRDARFIADTKSNLVPVPVSANWWVDHRLFYPRPDIEKDVDLVMVAGWGKYKRHAAFFSAVAALRRAGTRLRVLLLGYPLDQTIEDVRRLAAYYGIADQVEAHEWIAYEQVNEFLNRAKVNVLWSRREGVNRAIIEAMFANIPCVVREGFNYGYHYPYVNDATGRFSSERDLPETLKTMVQTYRQFSPREWVLANMTCEHAAAVLSDIIGRTAQSRGDTWSGDIVPKVNKLHNVEYWNPDDAVRFRQDYAELRTLRRFKSN